MEQKLYMVMLGCTPKGRFTEQHDIFFGIGKSLSDLIPQMNDFWPEANGELHIDVWREVTSVDGFHVSVEAKHNSPASNMQLFFINLGGYKENEFEEYHYKLVTAAETMSDAIKKAKITSFYKHYGFKGATSHIDDKYGIDVDDAYNVNDILPASVREQFAIVLTPAVVKEDQLHIGYLKFSKLMK